MSLPVAEATSNFDLAWSSTQFVAARATFFGRDAWNLNIGSCGYGFVCPNRWTNELASGYDLVAVSDKSPLYSGTHTGAQCGRCLEIKCRSAEVNDRYGARFDRRGLCKSGSVKVKVTDTCDCVYPSNAASNSRWCCGDEPHLDVSQWALDKLVDDSNKYGVFAISYRPIGCEAPLANPARAIPIVNSPFDYMKPSTLDCSTQRSGTPGQNNVSRGFSARKVKNSQRGLGKSYRSRKSNGIAKWLKTRMP